MKDEFDYTPEGAIKEQLSLIVKAARRCAYDLRHAADMIPFEDTFSKVFRDRADHWLTVFNPADDGKNYRHRLHYDILDLESEVERLKKLCEAHGISHIDVNRDIPF